MPKPSPSRKTRAAASPARSPSPTPATLLRKLKTKGPSHLAVTPQWAGHALHAMTFSAGCDSPAWPAYDFHGNKRGQTEWALFQFTLQGQGMLCYENKTQPVMQGQAMLLTLPHDHRYWLPENQHWSFFYLCMQGSEILRAWRYLIQQTGPLLSLAPDNHALLKAVSLCKDVLDNRFDSPWDLSARTYELAMSLLATTQSQHANTQGHDVSTTVGSDRHRTRPRAIQNAINLAKAHPNKPLDVDALAAAADLSRHHFSRCFKQSEGMSPGEYLTRTRLRQAVRLLQTTERPIKQIARQCSYADANYFAKAFRKAYGLSPRDFRERGLGRPASD